MAANKQDKFNDIIMEATVAASEVDASQEEYVDGLQHMVHVLEEELAAAKEYLEARRLDDD